MYDVSLYEHIEQRHFEAIHWPQKIGRNDPIGLAGMFFHSKGRGLNKRIIKKWSTLDIRPRSDWRISILHIQTKELPWEVGKYLRVHHKDQPLHGKTGTLKNDRSRLSLGDTGFLPFLGLF